MFTSSKSLAVLVLVAPLALGACGGSGEPPEITATTTTMVQNKKAQPAHDSRIHQLDDARLQALFSGREISGIAPDGRRWTASFDVTGGADIAWQGPEGSGRDSGSWEIKDNANCVTWQTLMDGEENCMTVYKVDDGQYNLFNGNGSMNSLITAPDL